MHSHPHNPITAPSSNTVQPLFGRQSELAALTEPWLMACKGKPSMCVLEAPSGGGKSHLLEAFRQRLTANAPVLWLTSIGRAQAAHTPLESLLPIMEHLQTHPALCQRVMENIRNHHPILRHSHPLMQTLVPDTDALEADPSPRQVSEAWSALLHNLGTLKEPVMLVLDDVQWADAQSLQVLYHWWNNLTLGDTFLMVILASRSEDIDKLKVSATDVTSWLALRPLDRNASLALGQAYTQSLTPDLLSKLHELSNGNPFLFKSLLAGLLRHGKQQDWDQETLTGPQALAWLDTPGRSASMLRHLLAKQTDTGRALLEAGAVLGRHFHISMASHIANIPKRAALRLLKQPSMQHIIQFHGEDEASFLHDKVREAALHNIQPKTRQDIHTKLARWLLQQDKLDPFALAYHFHQANQTREARPYAITASQEAQKRGAMSQARDNLNIALKSCGPSEDQLRYNLLTELGHCAIQQGHYNEALTHLLHAEELVGDPAQRTELYIQLGEVYVKHNKTMRAQPYLEDALRQQGIKVPTQHLSWFIALCLITISLMVSKTVAWIPKQKPALPPKEILIAKTIHRLGYVYGFQQHPWAVPWALVLALGRFERYAPSEALGLSYNNVIFGLLIFGRLQAAQERAEKNRRIAAEIQSPKLYAQIASTDSLLHYSLGDMITGEARADQAFSIFERLGNSWDANLALYTQCINLLRLGRLRETLTIALKLYQRSRQADEWLLMVGSVYLMHRASGKRLPCVLPQMKETLTRNTEVDLQLRCSWLRCQTFEHMRTGHLEEALKLSLQAQPLALKLRLEYVSDPIFHHVSIARQAWESQAPGHQKTQHHKTWKRALAQAKTYAKTFKGNLPFVLREEAWWHFHHKNQEGTEQKLQQSHHEASTRHMAWAVLLVDETRLKMQTILENPPSARDVQSLKEKMRQILPDKAQLRRVQQVVREMPIDDIGTIEMFPTPAS